MKLSTNTKKMAEDLRTQQRLKKELREETTRGALEQLMTRGEAIGPVELTPTTDDEGKQIWVARTPNNSPGTGKLKDEDTIKIVNPDNHQESCDAVITRVGEDQVQLKIGAKDETKATKIKNGYLVAEPYSYDQRVCEALERLAQADIDYPREKGHTPKDLPHRICTNWQTKEEGARGLILGRNDLCGIQGPPGTGKTRLLAQSAKALADQGQRVLIAALSNQAVENALLAVTAETKERYVYKKGRRPENPDEAALIQPIRLVEKEGSGKPDMFTLDRGVIGATFHSLATIDYRPKYLPQFDTIFVDEAGQAAEHYAASITGFGQKMVLFGDHAQLAPVNMLEEEGIIIKSAIEQLEKARPEYLERLNITHRLNAPLCEIIKRHFYSNGTGIDLKPSDRNKNSKIKHVGWDGGILMLEHREMGWRQHHPAEIEIIVQTVKELLTKEITHNGRDSVVDQADIVVLTPFRWQALQVTRRLQRENLGGVHVGTVDKMQGRTSPITIYSMTASHPEQIGEQAEFLFQPNRWNVALSRSNALTLVVGNVEAHLKAKTRTIAGMKAKKIIEALLLELKSSGKIVA